MDTGAYCPFDSMVREPCGCIIGDASAGAIPLGRLSTVRDSLRRCAYTAILEAVMSRGKSGAEPAGLSQLNLNAAGIDVGATSHFVAVPADRAEQSVREFEAFTADLYRLADWLTECRVETVAMESTGVYWIPLFGVLEERGFEVMLVDPRRIKNVPGRKTDVLDCQWLQQLHTYGLLSGAFRPDEDIRRLRSYLRQRAMLVEYASHHVQHLQKALTQMNVKLQHVISDLTGKTGMDIIEAIVRGERNPRRLARLRDPRTKADEATIAKSLRGHWRQEHIFELSQALELYRVYQSKIAECDREIETQLERFEDVTDGEPPAPNGKKRNQKNAPRFDVQSQLYRMTGVDLTRIDGGGRFHGPEGDQRDWHRHDEMAQRQALRVVAGSEPQQPHHRRQGHELKDQGQRQPGRGGAATGGQRAAPLRQRLGCLPAPEESPSGSAQGHYGHGPQAGPDHLLHAALRPGIRRCRSPVLRESVPGKGVADREAESGAAGLPAGAPIRSLGIACAPRTSGGVGVTL